MIIYISKNNIISTKGVTTIKTQKLKNDLAVEITDDFGIQNAIIPKKGIRTFKEVLGIR